MCMFRFQENFLTKWLQQTKEENIWINLHKNI